MRRPKDSRWIDPAPLEVSRPRLPWWTLLPGWVKLALSPVAAVVLLCWLAYQVGRVVYRYPLSLVLLVTGWWSYSGLGAWWFCALLAGVLGVLGRVVVAAALLVRAVRAAADPDRVPPAGDLCVGLAFGHAAVGPHEGQAGSGVPTDARPGPG